MRRRPSSPRSAGLPTPRRRNTCGSARADRFVSCAIVVLLVWYLGDALVEKIYAAWSGDHARKARLPHVYGWTRENTP